MTIRIELGAANGGDDIVLFWLVIALSICVTLSILAAIWRAVYVLMQERPGKAAADWDRALNDLHQRRSAYRKILTSKSSAPDDYSIPDEPTGEREGIGARELGAIDLFVEKAQLVLTQRGNDHRWLGAYMSWLVFVILLAAIVALLWLIDHRLEQPTWEEVVVRIASTASVAGILLGAAFFMGSLARAHMHEATTLYNRRHAVRLGRLYLYLKFLSGEEWLLTNAKEKLTVTDMERAFGGIVETSTAFKDIKAEILTSTWLGQLTQAIARTGRPFPSES